MDGDARRRHDRRPGPAPAERSPEHPDAVVRSEGLVEPAPSEVEQAAEGPVRARRAERRLRYHTPPAPRRYGK